MIELVSHNRIILISLNDGVEIDVHRDSCRLSTLLKNILDDFPYEELGYKIPNIDGEYLKYIGQYLNNYIENDPKIVQKPLLNYDISLTYGIWEDGYMSQFNDEKKVLWKLLDKANFFGLDCLTELICSKIACIIHKLDGMEMLKYFELKEDMTDEDIIQMDKEFEEIKKLENFGSL